MKIKHSFIITLIALILTLGIGCYLGGIFSKTYVLAEEKAENVPIENYSDVDWKYVVREYESKIAVFSRGNLTPDIVFDVFVSHLPESDKIEIENGIYVNSYETLISLIEDLTS